jgi:hypothetical protein
MFAACANSSIIDSDAQLGWATLGARSGDTVNNRDTVLPLTRRLGRFGKYWSPVLNDSNLPPGALTDVIPGMREGAPRVDPPPLADSAGIGSPTCAIPGGALRSFPELAVRTELKS